MLSFFLYALGQRKNGVTQFILGKRNCKFYICMCFYVPLISQLLLIVVFFVRSINLAFFFLFFLLTQTLIICISKIIEIELVYFSIHLILFVFLIVFFLWLWYSLAYSMRKMMADKALVCNDEIFQPFAYFRS